MPLGEAALRVVPTIEISAGQRLSRSVIAVRALLPKVTLYNRKSQKASNEDQGTLSSVDSSLRAGHSRGSHSECLIEPLQMNSLRFCFISDAHQIYHFPDLRAELTLLTVFRADVELPLLFCLEFEFPPLASFRATV